MSDSIIRVENLHHTYLQGSPNEKHALQGLDLTVARGEYLAIIGHNGSGKSTLARHLNGLLVPTRGDVWVNGWNTKDSARRIDVRSTVGMVFQNPDNQIVATIVQEDVAFGPENLGVPRAEIARRVDWALDTVELQPYRHHAPHLLSGGQKQRVAIAGVLAMQPQVLVFDESTALLDPAGRAQVLAVAKRLNESGATVVAVTHFMHEAALADRVIVLADGVIALQGTPREVFGQADRLHKLQLDVPEITQLAERLHALDPIFPQTVLTVDEFVTLAMDRREGMLALPRAPHDWDNIKPSESSATPAAVCVRGLEHTYLRGTPLESTALRGVDFDAAQGHIVGIIGHTGSGKSTLVQHFNGLLRPQRGSVRVLDADLGDAALDVRALRRRVGLAFQFPEAQLFERYVGDDVAFAPWQAGLRGDELRRRVRQAMDSVGLAFEDFKDRPIYALSGGERRRAALAGVLAMQPEILALDEPTAGLDPRGHADILARLKKLHDDWAMTLVVVSHNMQDIARLCDQIYVIADGHSVFSGAPREVFSQVDRLGELGLGVPQVTEAMHALRTRGIDVRSDVLTVDEAVAQFSVGAKQSP